MVEGLISSTYFIKLISLFDYHFHIFIVTKTQTL